MVSDGGRGGRGGVRAVALLRTRRQGWVGREIVVLGDDAGMVGRGVNDGRARSGVELLCLFGYDAAALRSPCRMEFRQGRQNEARPSKNATCTSANFETPTIRSY
jgi:hypothetical protein